MAEEGNRKKMETCTCGTSCACSCGCGWSGGHRAFRIVLGIVVLLVVFFAGVKMGEIREAFSQYWYGDGYGYGYPAYGWHHMMMYGGGYGDWTPPAEAQPQSAQTSTAQ